MLQLIKVTAAIFVLSASAIFIGCGKKEETNKSIAGVYRNAQEPNDPKFFVLSEDGTYAEGVIPTNKPLGYMIHPDSGNVSFEKAPSLVFNDEFGTIRDFNRTFNRTDEDPERYKEEAVKNYLAQDFRFRSEGSAMYLSDDNEIKSIYHEIIRRKADGSMRIDEIELYPIWKKHVTHSRASNWSVEPPYYVTGHSKFLIHHIDDQKFTYLPHELKTGVSVGESDYFTELVGLDAYSVDLESYVGHPNITTLEEDGFVVFDNLESHFIADNIRLGMTLDQFRIFFETIKIDESNKTGKKTANVPNFKFGAYKYNISTRDVRNPGSGFQITNTYLSVANKPAEIELEFVSQRGAYVLKTIRLKNEIFPDRTKYLDGLKQFSFHEYDPNYVSKFLRGNAAHFNIEIAQIYLNRNPWLKAERLDSYRPGNVRDSLTAIGITGEKNGHEVYLSINPAANMQTLIMRIPSI